MILRDKKRVESYLILASTSMRIVEQGKMVSKEIDPIAVAALTKNVKKKSKEISVN